MICPDWERDIDQQYMDDTTEMDGYLDCTGVDQCHDELSPVYYVGMLSETEAILWRIIKVRTKYEDLIEIPINQHTTCSQILDLVEDEAVEFLREDAYLVAVWRNNDGQIALGLHERPFDILEPMGSLSDEVEFHIKLVPPGGQREHQTDLGLPRRQRNRNGMRDSMPGAEGTIQPYNGPGTLELQDLSVRLQSQIEDQQEMLLQKDERLRYLLNREAQQKERSDFQTMIYEELRENVMTQERKIKSMGVIQNQFDQYRLTNTKLHAELETLTTLFENKEKSLSMALSRVEELNNQLQDVTRITGWNIHPATKPELRQQRVEEMQKELERSQKLTGLQRSAIEHNHALLRERESELQEINKRIEGLQQRLIKKKQSQRESQPSPTLNNKNTQDKVASMKPGYRNDGTHIESVSHHSRDAPSHKTRDDLHTNYGFDRQDPRNHTLPPNLGFPYPQNGGKAFNPTNQPTINIQEEIRTGGSGQSSPATSDNSFPVSTSASRPQASTSPRQGYGNGHPPKPTYTTANHNHIGPAQVHGVARSYPYNSTAIPSRTPKPPVAVRGGPVSSDVSSKPADRMTKSVPANLAGNRSSPPASTAIGSAGTNSFSTKHPYQTPLVRPSQRSATAVVTTGTISMTVNSSNVPPKPSIQTASSAPPNVPTTTSSSRPSSNRPGQYHSNQQQSLPVPRRWPKPSPVPTTSPTSKTVASAAAVATNGNGNDAGNMNGNSVNGTHGTTNYARDNAPSSATVSALKSGPRYASKSVIADTYTQKLGSVALEQFHKNMSMLINKDFGNKEQRTSHTKIQNSGGNGQTFPSVPAANKAPTGQAKDLPKIPAPGQLTDKHVVRSPSPSHSLRWPGPPTNSTSNFSQYASDKPSYKSSSIKHLRRRHSDSSDSEDLQVELVQNSASAANKNDDESANATVYCGNVTEQKDSSGTTSTDGANHKASSEQLVIDNMGNVLEVNNGTDFSVTSAQNKIFGQDDEKDKELIPPIIIETNKCSRKLRSNLKGKTSKSSKRRVSFDPLAILLDAALEGELELVQKTAKEVKNVSASNDEGITALHNAICAGRYEIVKFLVEFGADVNSPDTDGWTPLHCAASCNNLPMVKLLVNNGARIFATTVSDPETAAQKCEEDEDGYVGCSDYLYSIQQKLGIMNNGVTYAVFDYAANKPDELSFPLNSKLVILSKGNEKEKEWWWARLDNSKEGYVPRNLLGLFPRVTPRRSKMGHTAS